MGEKVYASSSSQQTVLISLISLKTAEFDAFLGGGGRRVPLCFWLHGNSKWHAMQDQNTDTAQQNGNHKRKEKKNISVSYNDDTNWEV